MNRATSAFAALSAIAAGLAVTEQQDPPDQLIDCHDICEKLELCRAEEFDHEECIERCESLPPQQMHSCQRCLNEENATCTSCSAECAPLLHESVQPTTHYEPRGEALQRDQLRHESRWELAANALPHVRAQDLYSPRP